MNLTELTPKKALNKAFLKLKPNRIAIDSFKHHIITLLDNTNDKESEEFHKNLVSTFLKKTYYDPNHFINTKGRNDLVIHTGNTSSCAVGVIIEAKKPTNKAEMMTTQKLNVKAFQELVLYYLRERITHKNLEIKHLIATNINEWFIFDAILFDRLFAQNKLLVQQFNDFESGRLADTKTDFFYKEIAKPFIEKINTDIEFTYFNIQDYQQPLRNADKADDNKLIALFKLLSPEHLLKLPFANDSNSLDKRFYSELLHIIGLTETKDGGKKLIERNKADERHSGTILEDTIIQLDSLDKLNRIGNINQFGTHTEERLFNVALELCITWINRILFLKLLEAQLIAYHKGDTSYSFLTIDKIASYDDLNSLFFQVLARKHDDRNEDVKHIFEKVPYLNSSLFEPTELEQVTLFISNLKDHKTIPVIASTVLKDTQGKKQTGTISTIQYLFSFLDAYDFGAEGGGEIQEDNKTLITAPVLGLIFEKINGYKDGSFFTPGFITMYMCRETIRKTVVQKFKEYCLKHDLEDAQIDSIQDIYALIPNKISKKKANEVVNSLKICDPAVGSGHFLVSALNEIITVKNDLKILADKDGKSLHRYEVEVVNDELMVTDEDGEPFEYNPNNKESQRIQETLFNEKQTIIENCLFGVDINTNSVKICRLRLWIELLKNAYYEVQVGHTPSLQTLPNIDINIKCGNSLVSRFAIDADLKQALRKSKWTIDSYRVAVATYRNAESKEQKREMERMIADIKSTFKTEISKNDSKFIKLQHLEYELSLMQAPNLFKGIEEEQSIYGNDENKQKSEEKKEKLLKEIELLRDEIEAIKSNKIFENAFEWRFEFPEVLNDEGDFVGFDVVIGNPPYVDFRELDKSQTIFLKNYKTNEGSPKPNLYQFFIELGYNIMCKGAYFCYINPNQFLSIDAGYGIRKFIVENTIIQFIDDISNIKVFDEAATYTVVWCFKKEKNGNYPVRISKCLRIEDIGEYNLIIRKNDIVSNGKYLIIANINQFLINKIEKENIKLGTLCEMIWGTSQSGYGQKKIKLVEYEILSSTEKTAYSPIIQTRDIKKYIIDWKEEYIPTDIFSVKAVSKFQEIEKIVIARMTLQLQAAIDTSQRYVGKSTVVFDIDKRLNKYYLLALLNSKLINFWYCNYFENTHLSGGYIRFDIPYLKKIPIVIADADMQDKMAQLVQEIVKLKHRHLNHFIDLENKIDQLVYQLYGLTEEEINIIESAQPPKL